MFRVAVRNVKIPGVACWFIGKYMFCYIMVPRAWFLVNIYNDFDVLVFEKHKHLKHIKRVVAAFWKNIFYY